MIRFLLVILFSNCILASYNSHGQVGYINTPSALNTIESSLAFIADRNEPDRKIILTASPFNWLDASIFYVDISNRDFPGFDQSYKDKGFSFKISLPKLFDHNVAFGMNDIAGTGFYNSEYLVFTKAINKFEYSFGVGWGDYSDGVSFKNPLIKIDKSFRNRSRGFSDRGGSLDFNDYFSGRDASIFFGSAYKIDPNNTFFLEYDPTSMEPTNSIVYPERKTKFNLGYEYRINDIALKLSYIRNNNINLQASYSVNFLNYSEVSDYSPKSKITNYVELRNVLAKNSIGLKNIEKGDNFTKVEIRQNTFQNQHAAKRVVVENIKDLVQDKEIIIVSQYLFGMKTTEASHILNNETNIRNEKYLDVAAGDKVYETSLKLPIVRNSISPVLRNQIASREGFYFGGLLLEDNLEIIFSENIIFLSNFKYSLFDNFDELYIPPLNTYPNQVRSDNKDYLNKLGDGVSIGRFELNYFESYQKKHFLRLTAGLFEEMFGGYGVEYLYYPEGALLSWGLESFKVRKRDYDMIFDFQDYENTLSRISFQAVEPQTKVNIRLSYGEYLAGDEGYTLEFARRFDNGVEFGAFFSRTDVSVDQYGEGSFDKGIKLKIPISLFGETQKLARYEWHPLTKDPAALLIKSIDLREEISRYRVH